MVINTIKRSSKLKRLIFIFTLFCMVMLPMGNGMATQFLQAGQSPISKEEKSWWEDWSRDLNKNKIDDALEKYLLESNLKEEERIPIIVDYHYMPREADVNKLASFGWEVQYVCKYIESIVVQLPIKEIERVSSWDEVVMVEFAPDGQFTLSSALPSIGVPEVWQKLGYDGEGITIAIIDTGVDDEHVGLDDLDDNPNTDDPKVIAFYDAHKDPNNTDGTKEPYDEGGHGTHCSGVAAGTGAPGYNHIGVAPKANLVGIKIGNNNGIPQNAALRGLDWAIANKDKFGIDILSNSWGFYFGTPAYQNGESAISRTMDEAVEAGLAVFVAAGNTAVSMTVYAPGDSERAITVGSVNDNHVLSIFSSQGPTADGRIKPDVCAIGEEVRSPNAGSGTGYGNFGGTSAATPMAAGLAALMLQADPNLEPDDVKQIMHETSEHNTDARFPFSPNNGYGWGVVEAYGAVKRSRDLHMTFLTGPSKVHEGDDISFSANTTYTRTLFTNKGEDGMRLVGDDEIIFVISVPASWGIPTNRSATSEGNMSYDAYPAVPRFENNMWVWEVEFHYSEDVIQPAEATPKAMFQSLTATVGSDADFTFFLNITLNGINATRVTKNITVDNQDPPVAIIESPGNGDPVSGIVTISGYAYDPDVGDEVEVVEVKINNGNWEIANGTTSWYYDWNTTLLNNGWYSIRARAFDGDNYSSEHDISVYLDNLNLQPWAIIDSISPNPANEGEEVSFTGHGDDNDGFIVEFEWKSNIDGILSDNHTFSTSALSVGTHQISFRVKDNDGVWSQKVMVNIRINQIPIAYIEFISPNPANEGETVGFSGYGSDDRAIVAYNWRSDIDGFLSNSESFSMVPSLGVHQIYLRVQDDDGVWSEETMQNLRINKIPEAFIDSVSPNPAVEGEAVGFTGHGIDDGNIIAYEWKSSLDEYLNDLASFSTNMLSVGDHVISLRVEDNDYVWSNYVYQNLKIKPKPKAFIDSISPNPANEGYSISFNGHGEDVGSIINYSWHSSIDDHLSDAASFSNSSLTPETHTIFFSVQNDNDVWSDEVTAILRINGAPTAHIDSISPNPALLGQDVQFEGHGEDDTGIINYSWYSSIDGFMGNNPSFTTNQLPLGDHNILFKVQDSDYIWSDDAMQLLRIHTKPEAHIDSISPNPANEGHEVTFEGHGSDDGAIAAYEWYSNINGSLSQEASFTSSTLITGEHEISFRVMDNDGEWSDFVFLSLRINQIPISYILSLSPNPANEGNIVTFIGDGSDDRNIVGYNWRSSINGFLGILASFSTSSLLPGEHIIYFMVRDDDGVWSKEVNSTLRINQIPVAYIDSITPAHANEGETINFVGEGSDDGIIMAYNWTSSIDSFLSDQKEFIASDLSIGDHVITFAVMDEYNAWSDEVQTFLRVNQIPVAYIYSISPNPAMIDQTVNFVGYGEDDDEIESYYWSSSLDDYLSNSDSFTWFGLSIGEHVISFKVKDKDEVWSEERYFLLKVHERPKARITDIIPDFPNEDDVISFLGEGTDDGIISAYNWTSDIDGFLSGQEKFNILLSPGTHIISLTVMDDENVWSKKTIRRLEVNGIPTAYIDSITPNPADEGDLVTLTGHGIDDGDIVAYQWTSSIDGIIGTESSMSITYLSVGVHDIYLKVKDDEDVWSKEAVDTLVIDIRTNQLPTITLLTPTNWDLVTEDVIQIQAEAYDEDGTVESIEIRVDDNDWFEISDSSFAFYSLNTEDIGEGEHVLYVRAYDGEDYSTEEFVIINVEQGEDEGSFFVGDEVFIISFILVIVLIVGIVLYWLSARRKKRSPHYIRL
jgi:subtilisin family serine protease